MVGRPMFDPHQLASLNLTQTGIKMAAGQFDSAENGELVDSNPTSCEIVIRAEKSWQMAQVQFSPSPEGQRQTITPPEVGTAIKALGCW